MPHVIKQGSTPKLRWQMNVDLDGKEPVLLSIGHAGKTPIISREATVIDAANGILELDLTEEETATVGYFDVEAFDAAGLKYPNSGYESLQIFTSVS